MCVSTTFSCASYDNLCGNILNRLFQIGRIRIAACAPSVKFEQSVEDSFTGKPNCRVADSIASTTLNIPSSNEVISLRRKWSDFHETSSLFLGLLGTALIFIALTGTAETVIVKYRGPVDLSHFDCEQITRSSVVKGLCYDSAEKYVIVNLTGTYYHYCEVPPATITAWRQAESMGRFYNAQVKGRFDCRVLHIPSYAK